MWRTTEEVHHSSACGMLPDSMELRSHAVSRIIEPKFGLPLAAQTVKGTNGNTRRSSITTGDARGAYCSGNPVHHKLETPGLLRLRAGTGTRGNPAPGDSTTDTNVGR